MSGSYGVRSEDVVEIMRDAWRRRATGRLMARKFLCDALEAGFKRVARLVGEYYDRVTAVGVPCVQTLVRQLETNVQSDASGGRRSSSYRAGGHRITRPACIA